MISKEDEQNYINWLESIIFVDKNGNAIPLILSDDDSDDPENDKSG